MDRDVVSWPHVQDYALALGRVSAATSYGEPSLKVGKALLTRHRLADNSIVLKSIDVDERDLLLGHRSEIFFIEEHYLRHDIVLARLAAADLDDLSPFILRTWQRLTAKSR